ncbi:MAG: adenylate/guanylate cyclase domain-containing protein [Spirochaetia bacterium]|jgi:class 3 adenylate cyclase/tetratricopeptide (TPR) repeat protein
MKCSRCGSDIPSQSNFCPQCGAPVSTTGITHVEERRKVTVFFSDVSGYTAMSERLDTEDVKDIMARIFSRAGDIVARLDGHISKYIGDCVMVLFGYPTTHEDDAVRAVQAAMELHAYVESLNTEELVSRIGRRISLHTGMNTGPVVAGRIDMDKGHEDVLGDTINVASRFDGIAGAGEILVGLATQQEAARCFDFQEIEQQSVKGKSDPLRAFRVRGRISMRQSICLDGTSSPLIGRKRELAVLHEALAGLKQGIGAAFSICGVPGSGKTRLVEELAKSVEVEQMRYLDAVCHEYTRNIPYSLWTNFLSRQWNITESESPESIRQKIEAGVRTILPDDPVRYISAMFALPDLETRNMDAGFLKAEIHGSVIRFVTALMKKERSVLCFEDMHWADPSSIELLGALLSGKTEPALFLFVSRPPFLPDFLTNKTISIPHQVVMLGDLSSEEEEQMVCSLLRTSSVPPDLTDYVRNRIKGNPLFIQEVVNNLIEQKLLVREQSWKLVRGLSGADIPGTVQNVIAARLDRLSPSTKRLVQIMAVIGPTISRSLVERLGEPGTGLDTDLRQLLDMEIIQEQTYGGVVEYAFKHALLREAAYESLLKIDRRQLHERVAGVLEGIASGTLSEEYGAIAHHYSQSGNVDKAVEYLVRAADQYLARYAAEEANNNYQEAYDLLVAKEGGTAADNERLIGLLNKWGWVFYFYGNFRKSVEVHEKHLKQAEAVDDPETKGMFFSWYSFALLYMIRIQEAIRFASIALEIGERTQNKKVIAYANVFLLLCHSLSGNIRESHPYATAAEASVARVHDDPYLYYKYLNQAVDLDDFVGPNH